MSSTHDRLLDQERARNGCGRRVAPPPAAAMLRLRSEPVEFVSLLDLDGGSLDVSGDDCNGARIGAVFKGTRGPAVDAKVRARAAATTSKAALLEGVGGTTETDGDADADDSDWAAVEKELRLLRTGGVQLARECELASLVGGEAVAREDAARVAARLRRFAGSEGASLLREVKE